MSNNGLSAFFMNNLLRIFYEKVAISIDKFDFLLYNKNKMNIALSLSS